MKGVRFLTKECGSCTVVEVVNHRKVLVEFDDGYRKYCRPDALKLGSVRNPYHPNLFGVGYIGEGKYTSNTAKVAYSKWSSMMTRCYCEARLQKFPTYRGVEVCKEWHNFQNFAKWCEEQDCFGNLDTNGNTYVLDKDLFHDGGVRRYSPETCCFIPTVLNGILTPRESSDDLPLGVYRKGFKFVFRGKDFKGNRVTYSSYDVEDTNSFYKEFRRNIIRNFLADGSMVVCKKVENKLKEIIKC